MSTPESIPKTDVSHLGTLVGEPHSDRIIAVATSVVFADRSLPQTFWGMDYLATDSGFQGHMYARPNDVLVVRVPSLDNSFPQMALTAIDVNHEIWKSLAGIQLLSGEGRIVLASDHPGRFPLGLPENLTWHVGGLLEAAATRYRHTGEAFLAFVLNDQVADMLDLRHRDNEYLLSLARNTSLLMDKNVAMQALQAGKVDCARTYVVDEDTDLERTLSSIPSGGRYVFKPAGGAAGIGVFSNDNRGASLSMVSAHLDTLRRKGQLPRRFQIQEFVPGVPYGITAWFEGNAAFKIFEAHEQIMNDVGRFIGGRWTSALHAKQMKVADTLCRQLATIDQPSFTGLICLDIIGGKIIEVNPRLTASAPISHLLPRQDQIARRVGSSFQIEQIDLNTKVKVPYETMRNGRLQRLVEAIWKKHDVLVLPQGLNPFGDSRFVFINDDFPRTAQQGFLQGIDQ